MTLDATRTAIGTGRILPADTLVSGRYRIVRLLGVGAMGMVYLARDVQLDLDIALKVLRTEGGASELRLERFRSELILARQISHRNVVRIHDIGQSGEMYYITMDYVEGRSLKQMLESAGPLDEDRAVAIAADLAEALGEAHRAAIVHRDVKPANVLIGTDRACLTDFGIARSLRSDGLTRAGEIVGTLDYLSPEQARGQPVDGRTDLYALGLLLYEMLTGGRPFSGESAEEVLAQRTLARPGDITASNADVTPVMRRIIERCVAPEPADRYQSADELLADLRDRHAARRWRLPVRLPAAAALVSALIGALLLWWLWNGVGTESPAQQSASAYTQPIAVLPFEVSVQTGDLGSISYALAELLSEQLATSTELRVVASQRVNSTLRDLKLTVGKLTPADQELLGDLLDASYLVSGRLQQINDSYRLDARLLRSGSGEFLYRTHFELQHTAEVFDAVSALAAGLLASFDLQPVQNEAMLPAIDADSLEAYTGGVEQLSRGNALDAIEPLEAVVRSAPQFALAWDRLAQALAALGRDQEAMTAADKAVAALDGSYGRAGALIRARRAALSGNPNDAARELEGLLRKVPADSEARFMLGEVYGDAGRLQDATSALQQVVEASPDHPSAWYLLGKFSILQGDAQRAVDDYLVKALVIQNRLDNVQGRADVLNALGIAQAQVGNLDDAATYYRQSLELRRRIGDDRGEAAVLANLARIDLEGGRYQDAHTGLSAARDKLKSIGDRWTVANLENELGFLEELRGNYEAALSHYREALRVRRDLGDQRALAESYNNIGYAYYLLGQYDNAAVFNKQSLDTYHDTGNLEGVMLASQTKGILDMARGRYDDALAALLETLRISRDIGDPQAEAIAEGYIGRVRHLQGRYAVATASFNEALGKLGELGDWRGLAEFTLLEAQLLLDAGMWQEAAAAIERAKTLMENDDNSARRALQLRIEGSYYDAIGDGERAGSTFREGLREAEASGDPVAVLRARLALTTSRHGNGDVGDRDKWAASIDELRAIQEAATRIGHGQLTLESGIALARAFLAGQQIDAAVSVLRDTLRTDAGGSHGAYWLHALLAQALQAQGRADEAASEWQLADAGIERAINAQTEGQRRAFQQLPIVRLVLQRQGEDHES